MSFDVQLQKLYNEIHSCHICPKMDPIKAMRLTNAVDSNMDVFIVSQALAKDSLRKTGVNFFKEGPELGYTGARLERFLNKFNRTVYPSKQVSLGSTIIRKADSPLLSVYNSEITQCFPGRKDGENDATPTANEIATCLGQTFLEREIALIKPKLLLLMGDLSRREFYKHFIGTRRTDGLQAHLDNIVESGSMPKHKVGELSISVLPIIHASPRTASNFNKMLANEPLIRLIQDVLAQT